MSLKRLDNIGIVVEDLAQTVSFFQTLGLKTDGGEMRVEGKWVDNVVGIGGVQVDIVMMSTPDGHNKLELMKFVSPNVIQPEPKNAPANTLGIRRLMFAVEDIDAVVKKLEVKGAELLGGIENYENIYRLCYLRGPEGIIIALAEQIG